MRVATIIQYLLPQKTLSRVVRAATRWRWRPWKDFLIDRVVRAYHVDMAEAVEADPRAYPSFNAFFTRALRDGARPLEGDASVVASPADGRISQAGRIEAGRIVQAKGRSFTVAELLADKATAATYVDGAFATIYLSPRDYHRVHMPLTGRLLETVHVPGRLFSVAPRPVADIPRLFARNERLVCHFEGEAGPFCVVMVGALLVSGITAAWSGAVVPPYARRVVRHDWRPRNVVLDRGAEMARFEMGSTVIVLTSRAAFDSTLAAEQPLKAGQRLGRFVADPGTVHNHALGGSWRQGGIRESS